MITLDNLSDEKIETRKMELKSVTMI